MRNRCVPHEASKSMSGIQVDLKVGISALLSVLEDLIHSFVGFQINSH